MRSRIAPFLLLLLSLLAAPTLAQTLPTRPDLTPPRASRDDFLTQRALDEERFKAYLNESLLYHTLHVGALIAAVLAGNWVMSQLVGGLFGGIAGSVGGAMLISVFYCESEWVSVPSVGIVCLAP